MEFQSKWKASEVNDPDQRNQQESVRPAPRFFSLINLIFHGRGAKTELRTYLSLT